MAEPTEPQPAVETSAKATAPSGRSGPARLVSLDAFRGLTIIGMLLVNNVEMGAATPAQFRHAPWNRGLHFADLVFPWFLFIVGVALPFSYASHRARGRSFPQFVWKALNRAAILVLLGCLIDSSLARRPIFDLDVLQLIGLAYLVGALLYPVRVSWRLGLAAVLLVGHWAAIRFVPAPGMAAGSFTEQANLIRYLNDTYFAPLHLQGIVSVVPTAALVLIGTAVGDLLRDETHAPLRRGASLLAIGVLLAGVGWLWSLDLPFNKPVWTASYIVFTAGLGSVVLAAFYLLADATGRRVWTYPFVVFGANAIFAYVAPILTKLYILEVWTWEGADGSRLPLQQAYLHALFQAHGHVAGGWLYTLTYLGVWWLLLAYMHHKRILLRV